MLQHPLALEDSDDVDVLGPEDPLPLGPPASTPPRPSRGGDVDSALGVLAFEPPEPSAALDR
eukprot:2256246-Pyramimonas_sp.AAC.1